MPKRKSSGRGRRYSREEKQNILQAALNNRLSAADVQRQFGVSPITFYRWRGPSRRGRRSAGRPPATVPAALRQGADWLESAQSSLRTQVRTGLRGIMPDMIRQEIDAYLREMFGSGSSRRNGRRSSTRAGTGTRRRRRRRSATARATTRVKRAVNKTVRRARRSVAARKGAMKRASRKRARAGRPRRTRTTQKTAA